MLFGVSAEQFLGFMVHERGIKVGQKSVKAIDEVVLLTTKIELQSLLGKINFIRRFISNLSKRILPFSPLLKLESDQEFKWGDIQQRAFEEIKEYMKCPPMLVPPQQGKPFKLYISADDKTIRSALIQEFEGKERVVFYLSRRLLDPETRYSPIKKLCLCLYFSCTKLQHNLLLAECTVVSKADVIKHMLSMTILNRRVGKWILAL